VPEKKKPAVPCLRFPEFRNAGPWEVKRLGEIGKITKGKGISKSDITPNGATPCIRYGELYTFYDEVIREVTSFTNVNPADLVVSKENDVIIPASGETKEDIAAACCVTKRGVALGGDLNIVRSSLNGAFLAYYIRGNLKSKLSRVAQGDSVVHLYPAQLEKLQLAIPSSVVEQRKIADCLSSLDDLIRAEAARLEALRAHKDGLMQQLFPREGETTPRLRFPEFRDAGPWEQVPLAELGTFHRGLSYSPKDVTDQGLLVLRAGNIQDGKISLKTDLVFVSKSCAEDLLLRRGDIVICMSNGSKSLVGKAGEFDGNSENELTVGAFCSIFRPRNAFARFAFRTSRYEKFVEENIAGGNINNLKSSDLERFEFYIPPVSEEQQKIADCLSSLDDLIRAEEARLEALQVHKKGLMQQLFPQEVG